MKAKWLDQDGQVFYRDSAMGGGVAYLSIHMSPLEAASPESFRLRVVDALLSLGSPEAIQNVILKSSVVQKALEENRRR